MVTPRTCWPLAPQRAINRPFTLKLDVYCSRGQSLGLLVHIPRTFNEWKVLSGSTRGFPQPRLHLKWCSTQLLLATLAREGLSRLERELIWKEKARFDLEESMHVTFIGIW